MHRDTHRLRFRGCIGVSAPLVGLLCPLSVSIIVSSQQSCPLTSSANHIWGWGEGLWGGDRQGWWKGGAHGSHWWWLTAGRACSDGDRCVKMCVCEHMCHYWHDRGHRHRVCHALTVSITLFNMTTNSFIYNTTLLLCCMSILYLYVPDFSTITVLQDNTPFYFVSCPSPEILEGKL